MLFRFRYAVLGGHTHVKVYSGTGTLAKCGDLTFRNEEWQKFMDDCGRADWQFVDDTIVEEQKNGGR